MTVEIIKNTLVEENSVLAKAQLKSLLQKMVAPGFTVDQIVMLNSLAHPENAAQHQAWGSETKQEFQKIIDSI